MIILYIQITQLTHFIARIKPIFLTAKPKFLPKILFFPLNKIYYSII